MFCIIVTLSRSRSKRVKCTIRPKMTPSSTSCRISSGAKVIAGGEVYPYPSTGYLQLNAQKGRTVRLFYDDSGAVSYLYLTGGTSSTSQAAVASSASAAALARSLGVADSGYTITKNGVKADEGDIAANDVAYYDAASGTLRVSDYRVTGYIESASPSISAVASITVAGCAFDVLESAWDTLFGLQIGSRVTLLLTDDNKVAAVSSSLSAEMVGVLSTDGRSVMLTGSGAVLSAQTMSYDASALGSLVRVSASSVSKLACAKLTTGSYGTLDLAGRTLGSLSLAPPVPSMSGRAAAMSARWKGRKGQPPATSPRSAGRICSRPPASATPTPTARGRSTFCCSTT